MPRAVPFGWLVVTLLSVASLGAAGADLRLIEAVKNADATRVGALLNERADVNAAEPDGTTALHWAAHKGHVGLAGLLIRAGANVNAGNRYGVTPLLLASVNGDATLIGELLRAGADPQSALPEGETALMSAARTGKVDAVEVLLAHRAAVNAREPWRGQTALMWAAAEGHEATIKALVRAGADVAARSELGFSPLAYATREGHIAAVHALLSAGADVNETVPVENPPGSATAARAAKGASAVQSGTSLLVLAVMNAHFELAGVLLDAGADPKAAAQGWTVLHELAWTRRAHRGTVPAPLPTGNLDSLALVKKLVAKGANVNARMTEEPRSGYRHRKNALNRIGATPFLLAARYADAPYMRLLHELGADPLLNNVDDSTPLMVAAGVGIWSVGEDPGTEAEVLEAVRVAWELGGDVNAVDKNGETAMHGAAYTGANTVVQFLVEKGAKLDVWNQKNSRGWTPLIIADGVYRSSSLKEAPHTAVLLRELLGMTPSTAR